MCQESHRLDSPSDPFCHWGAALELLTKSVKESPHFIDGEMVHGAGKCMSYLLPHKKIALDLSG